MNTGTRPNTMSAWARDRGVRLAAGLAVVVAIPMAVLFYFQFRSLDDLEKTSAVVLRQLSTDTAESLARSVEDYLKRPHISVQLRIPQARTEPLDVAWVDPILAGALQENPFVDAFHVWSERGPLSGRWLTFDRAGAAGEPRGALGRFRDDPDGGGRMEPKLRELARRRMTLVTFTDEVNGRRRYVQAQLRFEGPARERVTSVVAFAVDVEALRTQWVPALLAERLATVQQPGGGFPRLEVEVVGEDGDHVFVSNPHRSEQPVDERSFPIIFFDKELLEFAAPYEQHRETWRLRTGYGPNAIPEIVSASTRPQRLLMLVLAAVLALGVFLAAGAAAREVRLAELKSNFVASVSHDLKTPLALIQLFAETLELGRVRTPERAQEYYGIINAEARKLTRLIENILDFSRMEAGLRPYHLEAADLGDTVARVLGRLEHQLTQGGFAVCARIAPKLPRVLADEGAAEQAVENLLVNAMKYSGDARTIEVGVAQAGPHVVVSVADGGIGIPRREHRRIFRKFYRVQREAGGGGPQGTGLGLAIVAHTMRGHGGFVRVASEPGRGSTFSLHFPVPADRGFDPALVERTS